MWCIWDTLDCIPLVRTVARTVQAIHCAATGDAEGAKEASGAAVMNLAIDAVGIVTKGAVKVAMSGVKVDAKAFTKIIENKELSRE